MESPNIWLKTGFFACLLAGVCQTASGDMIYNVSLDTAPLVGHTAGPFYVELSFTDGSGVDDANNTITVSNISFGGGSALGSALGVGGASGSLESGVTIIDNTFLSLFYEQFAPGLQLSFSLDLTTNDDAGGIPDRFSFPCSIASAFPCRRWRRLATTSSESIYIRQVRSSMPTGAIRPALRRLAIQCRSMLRPSPPRVRSRSLRRDIFWGAPWP